MDDVVVVYIVYVTYARLKLEREAGAALGTVRSKRCVKGMRIEVGSITWAPRSQTHHDQTAKPLTVQ